MSKPDLTDDTLAARIRAACEAQAAALSVDDGPFEAAPTVAPELPPAAGRRPGRRLVAIAAAVALIGAVSAAVFVRSDDHGDAVRSGSTTTPAPASGDWLAPASAPLGLDLQSVTWSAKRPLAGFELRSQIFEAGDGEGRVLLVIQPEAGNLLGASGPTVRGQASGVMPSKSGEGDTMTWHEQGGSIDAQWLGMDQTSAVALIDQLAWRSADPMDGFDAPASSGIALVDDAGPDQLSYDVALTYVAAPGSADGVQELRVDTKTAEASTWEMLEAEFFDGANIVTDPGVTAIEEGSPGRFVRVVAEGGNLTDEQLHSIAGDLVRVDEAGLRALEETVPGADLASDLPATTVASPGSVDSSGTSTPVGGTPEDSLGAELQPLDGSEATTLAEVAAGRPMVVLLWATWCVPCIQSLEELDEVAAQHPGSVVVAVAVRGKPDEVQRVVDGTGVEIPILIDPEGTATEGFGASALPYLALIEADGRASGGGPATGAEGPAIAGNFLDEAG